MKCYVKGQSCMQCMDEWSMLCEVLNEGGNDTQFHMTGGSLKPGLSLEAARQTEQNDQTVLKSPVPHTPSGEANW